MRSVFPSKLSKYATASVRETFSMFSARYGESSGQERNLLSSVAVDFFVESNAPSYRLMLEIV